MGYTHGKRREAKEDTPPRVLTEDELKSLLWFAEHGPAPGLDVTTVPGGLRVFPTARMRDHLLAIGMLERYLPTGIYVYAVSEAGRAALGAAAKLDEMLAGMTEKNLHGEVDFGPAVGEEFPNNETADGMADALVHRS